MLIPKSPDYFCKCCNEHPAVCKNAGYKSFSHWAEAQINEIKALIEKASKELDELDEEKQDGA